MTKRTTKKTKQPTTLGVIVAIIIALIAAFQSAQKTNAPSITAVASASAPAASTRVPNPTPISGATLSATQAPMTTLKPLPTDLPGLEVTPINGVLYEITGSVGALGCPDSRCKETDIYKKGSIIVVTGTVNGTTYKTKKTRVWYQVISHDGSRVYVHGSYVKVHDEGLTN